MYCCREPEGLNLYPLIYFSFHWGGGLILFSFKDPAMPVDLSALACDDPLWKLFQE